MTAASAWRVEFDRAAARDLRKLGLEAERRVLRFLRERISGSDDPRRLGQALTGDRKGFGAIASATTASSPRSRMKRFVVLVVTVGHRREVYR